MQELLVGYSSCNTSYIFILPGATGQGLDAGPHSKLLTTPLPDETTRNLGDNVSDVGPVSPDDDVEMLSPEGPFC